MTAIDAHIPKLQLPRLRAPTIPRPRRPRLTAALAVVVLAALTAASWLLVRDSALVEVREVRIVGLSGYYQRDARTAVVDEAMRMTTMNFDSQRIAEAAGQFVDVADVRVTTDFPHAATIHLEVRRPVVIARLNGRTVVLSQTGEVMPLRRAAPGLPRIQASGTIASGHVTGGRALEAARLLGAAPDTLLRKVDSIRWGRMGVVVALSHGPRLYFGDGASAREKWRDAAAVLASSQARGVAYIDLRAPGRPAIGGLGSAPAVEAAGSASAAAAATAAPDQVQPATTTPAQQPAPATTPQQAPIQQAPAAPPTSTQPHGRTGPPAAAGGAVPGA